MKELEQLLDKTREGKVWVSISCKVDYQTKEKIRDHAAARGFNLNRFLLQSLLRYIKDGEDNEEFEKVNTKLESVRKKLDKSNKDKKSLMKEISALKKECSEKDSTINSLVMRYKKDMSDLTQIASSLSGKAVLTGIELMSNKISEDFPNKKG